MADREFYLPLKDVTLFCRVVGEGDPVILLHGHDQSHHIFTIWKGTLSQEHQVIMIDSRNHGNSSRTDQITIALMAEDVREAMEKLGISNAKIIGYSDGGNIALQLAAEHAELVSKLVVISGNAQPSGVRGLYRFFIDIGYWASKMISARSRNMMGLLAEEPDISRADLRRIEAPTLLIYGDKDLITRGHIRYLKANIPGSRVLLIKNATHFSIVRKFKDYINDIMEFLR